LEKNIIWFFGSHGPGISSILKKLSFPKTNFLNEPKIGLQLNNIIPGNGETKTYLEQNQHVGKLPKYDYIFFQGYQDLWKFYLRKLILNRIFVQFQDFSKKIFIKEIDGSASANILSNIFPNSKIIIINQDGRNLVNDLLENLIKKSASFESPSLLSDESSRKRLLKNQSTKWNDITNILIEAYENHDEKLRLFIRFEDFKKNPELIIKKIYKFSQIEISKQELQKTIDDYESTFQGKENNESWKNNFNIEERQIIENVMNENLHKLGFI